MIIKALADEDFVNYKKPAMLIAFPHCSFKCEKECGIRCCQNSALAQSPGVEISVAALVKRYMENPISSAIVLGGLEPFDSYQDLIDLIKAFRSQTPDDIVIYTGYKEDEITDKICDLRPYGNIIIKVGRYIPNDEPRYDELLGIKLASKNQYAILL